MHEVEGQNREKIPIPTCIIVLMSVSCSTPASGYADDGEIKPEQRLQADNPLVQKYGNATAPANSKRSM
jgi:hypothetical protein